MNLRSFDCPNCSSKQQYFLSEKSDTHLRQCPECDSWTLINEESTDGSSGSRLWIEHLGYSTRCPVASCDERFQGDEVAVHVIECHDGSLTSWSE